MDSFIVRKKRKSSPQHETESTPQAQPTALNAADLIVEDDESTDVKLAMLSSLHSDVSPETLLEYLLAHDGSVSEASEALRQPKSSSKKASGATGAQSSLRSFAVSSGSVNGEPQPPRKKKLMSRKGATLHLYDPADVAEHTPCTIIHNFLPPEEANALLRELMSEAESYERITFKLFDNVVASPHTSSFYVESYDDMQAQKTEYTYNGARLTDVRRITPQLAKVKPKVQEAVNAEIQQRIETRYPGGKKLRYQSPKPWIPNSAFVNCYNGPQESVGWHSDQMTYLGPRAVIGSISLGVAREFRVRRVVPRVMTESEGTGSGTRSVPEDPDAEGQISIHLPHNSLLVMHAEMQEEWKHSISPAQSIDPHPVAGIKRINITYRDYKANMHPRHTPKCECNIPCVLRVVQRKRENFGKYFWMCYGGNVPGKESCSFFQWARFDDDGNPLWYNSTTEPPAGGE